MIGGTRAQRNTSLAVNGVLMATGATMLLYANADTANSCEGTVDCLAEDFGEYSGDLVLVGAGVALALAGTIGFIAASASQPAADPEPSALPLPSAPPPGPVAAPGASPAAPPPAPAASQWSMSERRQCVLRTIPANPATGEGPREAIYCQESARGEQ